MCECIKTLQNRADFNTDSVSVIVHLCECVWYAPHTQPFTQIPRQRNHKEGQLSSNSCTIWESLVSTRREEEEEEGKAKEVVRIPDIPVPQKQDMCTGPLTLNDDGEKRSLKPG